MTASEIAMKYANDKRPAPRLCSGRRIFLRDAAACVLALLGASRGLRAVSAADAGALRDVRARTLRYIENLRLEGQPCGRYRYAAEMPEPTLYSSTYAAMTRGLYRDLGSLTDAERREWVEYLQSHQEEDGLFADPRIAGEGWYKGDPEWCGRRHLSCHVVAALTYLGTVAQKPFRWLEPFFDEHHMTAWLEAREWQQNADTVGNEVLNVGTLLQYARDFQQEPRAADAVRTMLEWLAHHQVKAETGLWGSFDTSDNKGLSRGVQGAYHFWLLFFYDRKALPYPERAVDHVLRTENPAGGFGWGVHGPRSSACEDIDSIDPLARMTFLADYRKQEIQQALQRALPHVLSNQNEDGGFSFIRGATFTYGHPLLSSSSNGSGMFPTWFRTLSLAYLGKALPDSMAGGFNWDFQNCPGIQFWLVNNGESDT